MKQNPYKKNNSKQVVITNNNAGQRIDNFLIRYFGKIPNSRIYQMLRKGEVRVNSGRIKQTYKLKVDDVVRVPPVYIKEKQSLKPNKAISHSNLGLALNQIGKSKEAIYHFRKAIKLKPDYYKAYINLGTVLMSKQKIEKAIDYFKMAIKINPDSVLAHKNLQIARSKLEK